MRTLISSPAVRMGVAISVAVGLFAISYGALAVTAGLTFWQTVFLSAFMFTGGSQLAFVGVVGAGGGFAAAAGAASLVGVRNGLYGMRLSPVLQPSRAMTFLTAQLTIDESMATSLAQSDPKERVRGFWAAGIGVWVLWLTFTIVGALIGQSIGNPSAWGLDGAAVAAYVGLLWPHIKSGEAWAIAGVCGLVTALTLPLLPPGAPILVAAVVSGLWGYLRRNA